MTPDDALLGVRDPVDALLEMEATHARLLAEEGRLRREREALRPRITWAFLLLTPAQAVRYAQLRRTP